MAGLEPEDLVEAHGTFYTSHCVSSGCRQEYSLSWMKGEGLEVAPEGRLPVPCVLLSARDRVSIHRHQLSPVQLCSSSLLSLSFFFLIYLFIYLAVPGFNWGMQDL